MASVETPSVKRCAIGGKYHRPGLQLMLCKQPFRATTCNRLHLCHMTIVNPSSVTGPQPAGPKGPRNVALPFPLHLLTVRLLSRAGRAADGPGVVGLT